MCMRNIWRFLKWHNILRRRGKISLTLVGASHPMGIHVNHYRLNMTLRRWPPCCLVHSCIRGGKDVTIVVFLWDSFNIIPEFAVLSHKFSRMCFVHFAFDVTWVEILWYCKIGRVGGPGDVCKTRNEFAWKHCPDNITEMCTVCGVAFNIIVHDDSRYGSTA